MWISKDGALGVLATSMISFSLGTPRVTFFEDTPAKWKVFNVIYVAGSPILYAAIDPIISPGFESASSNLDFISSTIQSKDCFVNLSLWMTFLVLSMYLR